MVRKLKSDPGGDKPITMIPIMITVEIQGNTKLTPENLLIGLAHNGGYQSIYREADEIANGIGTWNCKEAAGILNMIEFRLKPGIKDPFAYIYYSPKDTVIDEGTQPFHFVFTFV